MVMHECLDFYVFYDKTVLALKSARKQKKIGPYLLKKYHLYGIKQV